MLEALKKEVCEANLRLVAEGLVIHTWGNVSGIDRGKGLLVIKASGVSYDGMGPEHMVVVSMESGERVEGELKPLGTTHADFFYGSIPLTRQMSEAEINDAYELNTGKVIVERFGTLDPMQMPGVLVVNHGPFAWGGLPDEAVDNAVYLECVARMASETLRVDPNVEPMPQPLLDKHYLRKHGPDRYYGQE